MFFAKRLLVAVALLAVSAADPHVDRLAKKAFPAMWASGPFAQQVARIRAAKALFVCLNATNTTK